jgi:hypothetical protein
MRARHLGVGATLAGVVAGVVLASGVPAQDTQDDRADAPSLERALDRPIKERPRRADPQNDVEVRARDARLGPTLLDQPGDPAWRLRTFTARFVPRAPLNGRAPTLRRCAQLGRVRGTGLGWLDADRVLRALRLGDEPSVCTSAARPQPQLRVATTLVRVAPGDLRRLRTVVWGLAPPKTSVRATVRGRPFRLSRGPAGSFFAVIDGDLRERDVRVRFRSADGRTTTLPGRPPEVTRRRGSATYYMSTGDTTVETTAPDPAGGLPYGVLIAPAPRGGGWCVSSGLDRIVDGRPGRVDLELGLLTAPLPSNLGCPQNRPTLTRRQWFGGGYSSGGGLNPRDTDARRGRIERRTLRGSFVVSGVVHPAVTDVTIATPRDVRTLRPSRRARAILAVYDGEFPSGEIVLTARFGDGTTGRQSFRPGF